MPPEWRSYIDARAVFVVIRDWQLNR